MREGGRHPTSSTLDPHQRALQFLNQVALKLSVYTTPLTKLEGERGTTFKGVPSRVQESLDFAPCSAVPTSARLPSAKCKTFAREPRKREIAIVERNVCPWQSLVPPVLLIARKRLKLVRRDIRESLNYGVWRVGLGTAGAVTHDRKGRLSAFALPFFLFLPFLRGGK